MTTALIDLNAVKSHLRLDEDFDHEDSLLLGLIDASMEVCQTHIGRRFGDSLDFTPAIRVGCLMYIAFLYENREIVSEVEKSEVPMTISALWSVYRYPGVY
ncbi:head-tail connector protein [Citrobacter portucalensis]|uniref:head-tail connector protein n=1 Tax=Citrobacter portucalensis TaxID=1639133 RepID=UPI002B3C0284|nr:head-tail connector protein [Citrobacter portucalensis]MEB2767332.1 head-tail connector protein [Citrobacter portucalensis]